MSRNRLRLAILLVASLAAAVPVLAGRNDRAMVGDGAEPRSFSKDLGGLGHGRTD